MKIKHLKSFFALPLLALTACSQAGDTQPAAQQPQEETNLVAQIEAAIADTHCSQDSDCALLEFGARPCGGPESYLPYSKLTVDEQKLLQLAQAYKQQRQDYFKENQILGTCQVIPKPQVACVANQCRASQQGLQRQ